MPYKYKLENQRRAKRTLVALVLLAALVLLLLGPSRVHAWAGRAWETVAAKASLSSDEMPHEVSTPAKRVRVDGRYLTGPALADATYAVLEGCVDCDQWAWPYAFEFIEVNNGLLDPVDEDALPGGSAAHTGSIQGSNAGGAGGASRPGLVAGGAGVVGGMGVGSASGFGGGGASNVNQPAAQEPRDSVQSEPSIAGVSTPSTAPSEKPDGLLRLPTADKPRLEGASAAPDNQLPAPRSSHKPESLVLASITGDSPDGGVTPAVDNKLTAEVVRAVLTSPVGSETILGGGDAREVGDKMNLGGSAQSSAQSLDVVPESPELILLGLGLTVLAARLRQHRRASAN